MTDKTEKIVRQLSEEERVILAGFALFSNDMRDIVFSSALRAIERAKEKTKSAKVINFPGTSA